MFRYDADLAVFNDTLLLAAGEKLFFYTAYGTGMWTLTQEYGIASGSVAISSNRAVVQSYNELYHFEKPPMGIWIARGYTGAHLDIGKHIGLGNNHAVTRERGWTFINTLPALIGLAYCTDSDGDGWGWDSANTCRIGHTQTGTCEDSDGDYWGWNGIESCRIPR